MSEKYLRLIYNPYAGRRKLLDRLDNVIEILQENDYKIFIHRACSPEDIENVASKSSDVETLVVAGGDGSIHQAVNGLMKIPSDYRPTLGILPVGTANDFAYALNLPKTIPEACQVIVKNQVLEIDTGMVNNRYFINVASAGLLTDVSPKVDIRVKNTLGQLAYYLKGLETLPSFRPFKVEFEFNGKHYFEDAFLILALNGFSVGGLRQFVRSASLTDGKLDILIVRQSGWPEALRILLRLLRGEDVKSDKIELFQTEEITVYTDRLLNSDLDGEWGPESPWHIHNGPKISVIC